jgi:hypothetical protein
MSDAWLKRVVMSAMVLLVLHAVGTWAYSALGHPHALETYEYTLSMANGSSSVFQETLPASWRLGERVRVIAGAGPRE